MNKLDWLARGAHFEQSQEKKQPMIVGVYMNDFFLLLYLRVELPVWHVTRQTRSHHHAWDEYCWLLYPETPQKLSREEEKKSMWIFFFARNHALSSNPSNGKVQRGPPCIRAKVVREPKERGGVDWLVSLVQSYLQPSSSTTFLLIFQCGWKLWSHHNDKGSAPLLWQSDVEAPGNIQILLWDGRRVFSFWRAAM